LISGANKSSAASRAASSARDPVDEQILQAIDRFLQSLKVVNVDCVECAGVLVRKGNWRGGVVIPLGYDDLLFRAWLQPMPGFVLQTLRRDVVSLYSSVQGDWTQFIQRFFNYLPRASSAARMGMLSCLCDVCKGELVGEPFSVDRHRMRKRG
jgi:hypothetical protein